MNNVFKPIEIKLSRVTKQISELEKFIIDYSAKNPVKVECVLNEKQLGYKLIQKDMPFNPPIDEWTSLFGECIHNLRSLLDNFAYSLARIKQDPPAKPRHLYFPISLRREDFERNKEKSLEQFPDNAKLIIEKLQPFNRDGSEEFGKPENDLLFLLNELNNQDKHRTPTLVLIVPFNIDFNAKVIFETDEAANANIPPDSTVDIGPLESGKILFEHRTKNPIKSVEGNFNIQAKVGIQLNNEYVDIIELLKHMNQYINLVLVQFNEYL